MNKNPLLKYVMRGKKEDIFHSSMYGRTQNSTGMGASSAESFSRRREIDQNRTMIGGYGHSKIARNAISNGPRAKVYTPPSNTIKK